jgi:predicted aconitase
VSSFCAAITGRIPEYGFHLDENRVGTHLVKVEANLRDYVDYDLLGYRVAGSVMLDVPVFDGMPQPDIDKVKPMAAAMASSGGIQMMHITGVTPEAPTVEAAFRGDTPQETMTVGWDELEESYEFLNSTSEETVDYAVLGCPHLSMSQIKEVASLLQGKKLKKPLYICVSSLIKAWAETMGYAETIVNAGGTLFEGMCPLFMGFKPKGAKVMATNSCKQAHYSPGRFGLDEPNYGVRFGNTRDVINAASTGKWKGTWRDYK